MHAAVFCDYCLDSQVVVNGSIVQYEHSCNNDAELNITTIMNASRRLYICPHHNGISFVRFPCILNAPFSVILRHQKLEVNNRVSSSLSTFVHCSRIHD